MKKSWYHNLVIHTILIIPIVIAFLGNVANLVFSYFSLPLNISNLLDSTTEFFGVYVLIVAYIQVFGASKWRDSNIGLHKELHPQLIYLVMFFLIENFLGYIYAMFSIYALFLYLLLPIVNYIIHYMYIEMYKKRTRNHRRWGRKVLDNDCFYAEG